MPLTNNQLIDKYFAILPPGNNLSFLLKTEKHPDYAPLYHYIQTKPDQLIGNTKDVYNTYWDWCEDNDYELTTKNTFTRTIAQYGYFVKSTRVDGVSGRAYYKASHCPMCFSQLSTSVTTPKMQ